MVSIREVGLARTKDAGVLEWSARAGYILLTHDVSTMTAAAYQRLKQGLPMAGLVVAPRRMKVGEAVRAL